MSTKNSDIEHNFSDRVKLLRKELRLSQEKFAEKIGISRGVTISDWERGVRVPRKNTIDFLIKVYNVNPEFIRYGKLPILLGAAAQSTSGQPAQNQKAKKCGESMIDCGSYVLVDKNLRLIKETGKYQIFDWSIGEWVDYAPPPGETSK